MLEDAKKYLEIDKLSNAQKARVLNIAENVEREDLADTPDINTKVGKLLQQMFEIATILRKVTQPITISNRPVEEYHDPYWDWRKLAIRDCHYCGSICEVKPYMFEEEQIQKILSQNKTGV